jgi:hypothetical protein
MVKSATDRSKKYKEKTDAIQLYLQIKALKRAKYLDIWKLFGVQTEKDTAIESILSGYTLDLRQHKLALKAWRELYFKGYKNQAVELI